MRAEKEVVNEKTTWYLIARPEQFFTILLRRTGSCHLQCR